VTPEEQEAAQTKDLAEIEADREAKAHSGCLNKDEVRKVIEKVKERILDAEDADTEPRAMDIAEEIEEELGLKK